MAGSPNSVLVVEDVAIMRRFVELTLTRAGWDAWGAENGADALRLMATRKLDAAVIDINLPDMNGLAVAQQARDMQQNNLSIIFMATRWEPELPQRVAAAGGLGLLLMPFGPADLLRAVEFAMEKKSQPDHPAFGELPWNPSPGPLRTEH